MTREKETRILMRDAIDTAMARARDAETRLKTSESERSRFRGTLFVIAKAIESLADEIGEDLHIPENPKHVEAVKEPESQALWDNPPPCTCGATWDELRPHDNGDEPMKGNVMSVQAPRVFMECWQCEREIWGSSEAAVAQAWAEGLGAKGEVLRVK